MNKKIPLYAQLENIILRKIENGEYRYGTPIPSERELSETYGISRLTVRQALANLVEAGLIVKIPRKGAYVELPTVKRPINRLSSFSQMLKLQGMEHRDEVIFTGKIQTGYQLSRQLDLPRGSWFFRLCRLRYGNEEPIAFEDTMIPYERIPGIEEVDFGTTSLYVLYAAHGIEIARCEQEIMAVKLSAFNAELLEMPPGSPACKSVFRTYDVRERLVEYTVSYNHPNIYMFSAD